jgi:hypothetical protein
MKAIKKFIRFVLKIYKTIMRIGKYIDLKLLIEEFKKDDTTGVFGKPKERGKFTQFLMDNEEGIERAEKRKAYEQLEDRKRILRRRKRRSN